MSKPSKERCPHCLKNEIKVVDSRVRLVALPFVANKLLARSRRKRCGYCDKRFSTTEINQSYFVALYELKKDVVDKVSNSLDMVV